MDHTPSPAPSESNQTPPEEFPLTSWQAVARAVEADEARALPALNALVERYWHPLEAHLRRKFRAPPEQAEDWLQSFLHEKVVCGRLIAHARQGKGRFRTFLLNTLDNFVVSDLRKANALRRHPAEGTVPLDELGDDVLAAASPLEQDAFDLDWARVVIATALGRMESECRTKDQTRRWKVFQARLLGPVLADAPEVPYATLVERFGFRSPAETSNTLTTAIRMFRRILGEVVQEYERDAPAVDAEVQAFKATLDRAKRRRPKPGLGLSGL